MPHAYDQKVVGSTHWSDHYQVVITWMSDCLSAGKPSPYVTSRLGQLSLPSLRGR